MIPDSRLDYDYKQEILVTILGALCGVCIACLVFTIPGTQVKASSSALIVDVSLLSCGNENVRRW